MKDEKLSRAQFVIGHWSLVIGHFPNLSLRSPRLCGEASWLRLWSARVFPWFCLTVATAYSLMLGACATLQVPSGTPSFPSEKYMNASREGVVVRAYAMEHYEDYWQLFEEDLPKTGLGALWVRIDNTREGAISLKNTRWTLRKGGRSFAPLDAKDVLRRFYSGQGIRMYGVAAHEKTRKELERLILKGGTIPHTSFLEGFFFFKTDPRNYRWSTGATLSGRDIQLETGKEIEIELPISNANPGC
jgi:hypothetical protein